jgi:TonB family protein
VCRPTSSSADKFALLANLSAELRRYAARAMAHHPSVIAVLGTLLMFAQADATSVRCPPVYPAEAARACVEGWVRLAIETDEKGLLKKAIVIESDPPGVFDEAATKSLSATCPGSQRDVLGPNRKTEIVVKFKLDECVRPDER